MGRHHRGRGLARAHDDEESGRRSSEEAVAGRGGEQRRPRDRGTASGRRGGRARTSGCGAAARPPAPAPRRGAWPPCAPRRRCRRARASSAPRAWRSASTGGAPRASGRSRGGGDGPGAARPGRPPARGSTRARRRWRGPGSSGLHARMRASSSAGVRWSRRGGVSAARQASHEGNQSASSMIPPSTQMIPRTAAGCRQPSSRTTLPPHDCPATTGRESPRASITARRSPTAVSMS